MVVLDNNKVTQRAGTFLLMDNQLNTIERTTMQCDMHCSMEATSIPF